uniref:Uncharacterized protein n=1 Tax=Timema monikensis TaxID=170555 RepID=A0A7R9EE94_9NEOP|nr:unnamed protein product [Timema monikensis]
MGFLNLFSLNKEDEKESLFAGFLNLFSLKEDEKESELITTIKRSILLIQKEEFKKAEQMLHLALKLAQQQQNDQAVTYIHDLMANLAYDTEDFSKAETLFVNVLQRLIASGAQQDDNRVLHISYKMADIYKKMGNIEYLNRAVEVGDQQHLAAVYVNMGSLYLQKQMVDEAKRSCELGWSSANKHGDKEAMDEASLCLQEVKRLMQNKSRH